MGNAINQTQSALNAESASLLSTTQDWAWWDDMADFAVSHNTGIYRAQCQYRQHGHVKVHLFIVLDENGNLLYGRLLSPDFETNTTVPEDSHKSPAEQSPAWYYILRMIREHPGFSLHPRANDVHCFSTHPAFGQEWTRPGERSLWGGIWNPVLSSVSPR